MSKRTNELEVISYSDSNFANCVDSQKLISSYIFMFVGRAVAWMSAQQILTATFTIEVEFVSCFETTSYGVWIKSFIVGLELWILFLCR